MLEPSRAQVRALVVPMLVALAGEMILVLVDQDRAMRMLGFVPLAVATAMAARVIF